MSFGLEPLAELDAAAPLPLAAPRLSWRVFVTGATGCIGRRLCDELLLGTGCSLDLLVRGSASRLRAVASPALQQALDSGRVRVHIGDLEMRHHPDGRCDWLEAVVPQCDALVLCGTSWGGSTARAVNVEATLAIVRARTRRRCRAILYFSTASVVLPSGRLAEDEAARYGTDYIRSKWEALEALYRERVYADKRMPLVVLFPTMVLGSGSHVGEGVASALRQESARRGSSRLACLLRHALRYLRIDDAARAHFIHARDCARVAVALLKRLAPRPLPPLPARFSAVRRLRQRDSEMREACFTDAMFVVVGQQPPFTFRDAVHALCALFQVPEAHRGPCIPVDGVLYPVARHLFRADAWTLYCIQARTVYFHFPSAIAPEAVGATSCAPTLLQALRLSTDAAV